MLDTLFLAKTISEARDLSKKRVANRIRANPLVLHDYPSAED